MNVPKSNVIPMTVPGNPQPDIDPKYLAMAAAIMHQQSQKKPDADKD